jgi:predicted GIY-YIG superfamily endonuclease
MCIPVFKKIFSKEVKKKNDSARSGNQEQDHCKTGITEDFHRRLHTHQKGRANDLLNAGNPEQLVCQIAGWKSGNMIRQYYHKDGLRAVQNVVFSGAKPDT